MDAKQAIRRNLAALLDAAKDDPDGKIGPPDVLALDAESGVSKTTIYAILDNKVPRNLRLDTLIRLASAYKLEAWHLLFPYLDPRSKPHVLTPKERRRINKQEKLYELVKSAAQDDDEESVGESSAADRGHSSG